jgi:hypothetical protein
VRLAADDAGLALAAEPTQGLEAEARPWQALVNDTPANCIQAARLVRGRERNELSAHAAPGAQMHCDVLARAIAAGRIGHAAH